MFTNGYYAFRQFLKDHPEHAANHRVVTRADGTTDDVARPDVWVAFARWSLFHGHGDAQKIVAFLTEVAPHVDATFGGRGAAE